MKGCDLCFKMCSYPPHFCHFHCPQFSYRGYKQIPRLVTIFVVICRHDAIDKIEKAKKDKDIGEDDAKRLQKVLDESMAKAKMDVDAKAKAKEQEILTV